MISRISPLRTSKHATNLPRIENDYPRLLTVKLLFDQNLSPALVKLLADLHPGSSHVFSLGIDRATDEEIWKRARNDGYTIVTKDSDFGDLSVLRGFPPKVIWVRIGNCTTKQIEALIRSNGEAIVAFERDMTVGLLSLF